MSAPLLEFFHPTGDTNGVHRTSRPHPPQTMPAPRDQGSDSLFWWIAKSTSNDKQNKGAQDQVDNLPEKQVLGDPHTNLKLYFAHF
jgi:hypothetical protein